VCAVFAAAVGGFLVFLITINSGLCGNDNGPTGASRAAAGAAYVVVGGWAFQRPYRPLWGWPLAALVGLAAGVAVQAIVPGGHGFCET
jgi:hypothetical protein